jgi:hypothetical protein
MSESIKVFYFVAMWVCADVARAEGLKKGRKDGRKRRRN